jgi:hypothetical protein
MTVMATEKRAASKPPLRLEWWEAGKLRPNRRNWRRHRPAQADALRGVLEQVGWAGALLYNERTGRLIDGHLRREVAEGEQVPVLVGDWDEKQERTILATLDPIGAMAGADAEVLSGLIESVRAHNGSDAVSRLLDAQARLHPLPDWSVQNGPSQEDIAQLEAEMAHRFEDAARDKQDALIEVKCPKCRKPFGVRAKDVFGDEPEV